MKAIALAALFLPLAFAAEYLVGVGKDETTGKKGIGFDPTSIHPSAGDVIAFEFRSGSHSVVQSTFDNPCTGNGGFNTGVITVADSLDVDASGLPQVQLTVNDTNPIWFFDEAGGLCSQGAVLSANPSSTQTAAAFKENAAKAPGSVASSTTSSQSSTSDGTTTQTVAGSSTGSSASSATSSGAAPASTSNTAVVNNAVAFSGMGAVMAIFLGLL